MGRERDDRYPLRWPAAWPRTAPRDRMRARFCGTSRGETYSSKRPLSMYEATNRLQLELDRLGADRVILSTNVELRLDGAPRSDRRAPEDPGAAVYFRLFGKDVVMACDKWDRVEDNVAAIAAHIECLRGIGRYGVGRLEQAFTGYLALPAPIACARPWQDVLELDRGAARSREEKLEDAKAAYRRLAKLHHPDTGGSVEKMAELNVAMREAEEALA
jgi:hypothetical protein